MTVPAHAIRFGPYGSPDVSIGQEVICAMRGPVRVYDWLMLPIGPWARGLPAGESPGRPGIILMGDLVRALHAESAAAVAAQWGVSRQQVRRWRRAVGADRFTPGTLELLALAKQILSGRAPWPRG